MDTENKKPTTKPVAVRKRGRTTYHLHSNGELWVAGRDAYFCGYVASDIDHAIDMHEEELHYLLQEWL